MPFPSPRTLNFDALVQARAPISLFHLDPNTKKTTQNGRLGSLRDTISTFCQFFGPPILGFRFRIDMGDEWTGSTIYINLSPSIAQCMLFFCSWTSCAGSMALLSRTVSRPFQPGKNAPDSSRQLSFFPVSDMAAHANRAF